MISLRKFATALLCGTLALAAPASAKGPLSSTNPEPGVHVTGSASAKLKLTEYVSYTCPHCAHFEMEAGDPLRIFYVASGKVKIETRHFVRDPFDLTAAMLSNCGAPSRFDRNHVMFMAEQPTWLAKLREATQAQKNRYSTGTFAQRRQAIASDAGFYDMMRRRGYQRIEVDNCLADEKMAEALAKKTAGYAQEKGVRSTPSFALDDVILAGTHDWKGLKFQMDLRL